MKKKIGKTGIFLLLISLFWGCTVQEEAVEEPSYQVYYINKEETAVLPVGYEPKAAEGLELLEELMAVLSQKPENPDYKHALPDFVTFLDYSLEQGQLYLYFDGGYQKMPTYYEVLCRAAIVRTMCQMPNVEYVSFFVNDQALLDSNQMPVGLMTENLFVENTGDQVNTYNSVTLNLYFANATGDKLVMERDTFYYNSNMSLEKLILEQLIQGPVSDQTYPTIPPETKVLNISTKDGICYVNLDEAFLNQTYDLAEAVPIYSIVNSLEELTNINKVQILINGETPKVYRESISFETIFERNYDIIVALGEETNEGSE